MLKVFFLLFAILSLHCQYPSLAAEREDIILLMLLMYVHNQSKIGNLKIFQNKFLLLTRLYLFDQNYSTNQ